jgi:hypothetical protein
MSAERRRTGLFLAAAFLFSFVIWNAVFDAGIAEATRGFVREREADPNPRPVRIDLVMHAATVQSARRATGAGLLAFAAGAAAAIWWGRRRTRGSG